MPTVDQMMRKMGFPNEATGPFVTELRASIAKRIGEGLTGHSAGTWATGNHSHEERAKALLGFEWASDRGHCCRVECLDGFEWRMLMPWLGDQFRRAGMNLRILRDKALGIRNPYF